MLDEIYKIDKDFTEDKFKTFVDNIFIQIQYNKKEKTSQFTFTVF